MSMDKIEFVLSIWITYKVTDFIYYHYTGEHIKNTVLK